MLPYSYELKITTSASRKNDTSGHFLLFFCTNPIMSQGCLEFDEEGEAVDFRGNWRPIAFLRDLQCRSGPILLPIPR